MTYDIAAPTGAETRVEIQALHVIRKLTASQGARSSLYDVQVSTGKPIEWRTTRSPDRALRQSAPLEPQANIAAHEHIGRLLRECLRSSGDLLNSQDPQDSTLAGVRLSHLLQELWTVREAREENWRELINLLQILLTGEEFETLPADKRAALHDLFETGTLSRAVGQREFNQAVSLLRCAGFDLWRGIGGGEPDCL